RILQDEKKPGTASAKKGESERLRNNSGRRTPRNNDRWRAGLGQSTGSTGSAWRTANATAEWGIKRLRDKATTGAGAWTGRKRRSRVCGQDFGRHGPVDPDGRGRQHVRSRRESRWKYGTAQSCGGGLSGRGW